MVLSNIPFKIRLDEVTRSLRLDESFIPEIEPIFEQFIKTVKPKAKFGHSSVFEKGDGYVVIDGIRIKSRVLSVNLDKITDVYPYIVTSGREGYNMARESGDPLYEYWIDQMCEHVLMKASAYIYNEVARTFGTKEIYSLAPGSLEDWPMLGQRELFSLAGGEEAVKSEIGVELTDSCLMLPIKSISGLYFESAEHFVQCSLCPRGDCPSRREPFNESIYAGKYGLSANMHSHGGDCDESIL